MMAARLLLCAEHANSELQRMPMFECDYMHELLIPAMNEMAQYIELALVELSSLRRYWADHELDTGRAEWTRRAA